MHEALALLESQNTEAINVNNNGNVLISGESFAELRPLGDLAVHSRRHLGLDNRGRQVNM
jgi:hypothetical protein